MYIYIYIYIYVTRSVRRFSSGGPPRRSEASSSSGPATGTGSSAMARASTGTGRRRRCKRTGRPSESSNHNVQVSAIGNTNVKIIMYRVPPSGGKPTTSAPGTTSLVASQHMMSQQAGCHSRQDVTGCHRMSQQAARAPATAVYPRGPDCGTSCSGPGCVMIDADVFVEHFVAVDDDSAVISSYWIGC